MFLTVLYFSIKYEYLRTLTEIAHTPIIENSFLNPLV